MKFVKNLLPIFLCVAMTACASFPSEKLAKVESMPDTTQYKSKPKVAIDLKLFRGKPDQEGAIEMSQVQPQLQKLTSKILDDSQLFESYTYDSFEAANADYVIKLHFYNHGSQGAAAITGFLSGFTMGIIPGFAKDEYTLKAEVLAGQNSLMANQTDDAMNTYIGIWFIPVMGNSPQKAFDEVTGNMIKDALKKMVESKQLKYAFQPYPLRVVS
ncbi:hypothetical protein C2869_17910 [Saccharobesus litoralis]|uniref:Lipoprotein n=1 Tax=Saccharobesus litoralis TaxID=2172099 RepID=A0A2S0VVC3_9ALTE|nr:hypothetical protein [Saccharobesus litoralis]AWB68174.1 hypothetical protein C2869_17910 [Saccharobesus litoralis]